MGGFLDSTVADRADAVADQRSISAGCCCCCSAAAAAAAAGTRLRPTAYQVRKRGDADYHLLQFQGKPELLQQLDHALKITDGVNRFRIIKLHPGTPAPPDLTMSAAAAAAAEQQQQQPAEIER